jgi:hypothetical protein
MPPTNTSGKAINIVWKNGFDGGIASVQLIRG